MLTKIILALAVITFPVAADGDHDYELVLSHSVSGSGGVLAEVTA